MSINFRVSENNLQTINKLKNLQKIYFNTYKDKEKIEHEIFSENGAAYAHVQTNLSDRPLKLMIDTGASISLIAIDIVSNKARILDFSVKLSGIINEISVDTKGLVQGVLKMGDCFLGTVFHLVDRVHAGPADGYLGYDFLKSYKAIINISRMCLQIDVQNVLKDGNTDHKINEDESENGLHIIAPEHSSLKIYDIPETRLNEENYVEYYKAINNYKYNIKVHRLDHEYIDKKIYEIKDGYLEYNRIDGHTADDRRSDYIYEKLNISHCSGEEKGYVKEICEKYPHQFFIDGDVIGTIDIIKHTIKLQPNAKIINIRQYRIPHKHKKILDSIIKDFLEQGIIEKCTSCYNSPVMLLEKKDDSGEKKEYRFVVDYSKLNGITEIQRFPIPIIDDILDGLSGAQYFTTLDLKGAYYHITMDEDSRDCTAFTAGNFKYRWIKMPMGLAAAPFTWMRTVNTIFANLIGRGVFIYLDDVIVYGHTKEKHDETLREVLKLLKKYTLKLKISKCIFYAKIFYYLGHVITKDGYKANPKKIEIIKDYPRPTNVKKLQRFLGLCAYFRRYVKNFAKIAKPLTTLLKKEQPFIWMDSQQKAFDTLKNNLTEKVVLAFPDFEQLFYVTTDASDTAIGAMLSQGELPNDRPLYFHSRTLTDIEKRYSTIQKELLAIVEAVKVFRVYLYGGFFILITDHKALCYLFNMKDCGSKLFRQRLELLDYNFKVIYRPGAQNQVADALSRIKPLSIQELLEIEKKKETCHIVTRAQARQELKEETSCDIEEK